MSVTNYMGSICNLRTDVGNVDIDIATTDNGTLDGSIKTGVGDIAALILTKNGALLSAGFNLTTGVGTIEVDGIGDFTHSGFISEQASFELGAAGGAFTMETGTGDISVNVAYVIIAI